MREILKRPMTWSQIVSSLTGMALMTLAARALGAADFATFSLLLLAQVTAVGLLRSSLFQPSLVQQRSDPGYRTPLLVGAASCGALGIGLSLLAYMLDTRLEPPVLMMVVGASAVTFAHDWVRHLLIADGAARMVLATDLVRLVAVTVVGVAWFGELSSAGAFVTGMACAGPALLLGLVARPAAGRGSRLRTIRRLSSWQTLEFTVAQFQTTVPLMVVGALSMSETIGAFRLAQTFIGPVNLFSMALGTNLLADSLRLTDRTVWTESQKLARLASAFAALVCVGAVVVAFALGPHLEAVGSVALVGAVLIVGVASVGTSFSGVLMMGLRILRRQRDLAAARVMLVLTVWAAYGAGWLFGAAAGAVSAGYVAAAVASPLAAQLIGTRWKRGVESH